MVTNSNARLRYYMKIYRLAASPDGKWLAASDNMGRICLFNLTVCLSTNAAEENRRLSHHIQLQFPAFAMKTVDQLLVCGDSHGNVIAYDWTEIVKKSDETYKPLFSFGAFDGVALSVAGPHEINSLHYCSERERLFVAGGGDNTVKEYDINTPKKCIGSLTGHSDSVCELASKTRDSLLSSSADGSVRIWDVRKKNSIHTINVADEPKVSRPHMGKCVSGLAVESGFIICGGGVDLGIWHMGSYSLAGRLHSKNDVRHLTVETHADKILTGSMQNTLSQWDFTGQKLSDVEGRTSSIYSILQCDPVFFSAGDSHLIDVYLNLGYVSFSLDAFPM